MTNLPIIIILWIILFVIIPFYVGKHRNADPHSTFSKGIFQFGKGVGLFILLFLVFAILYGILLFVKLDT